MKNTLLIVSAFLLFQTAAVAQGAIDGRVLNAKTANGVANVTVNVVGPDGKVVATVTTDDSGGFTFEDLAAGTYKIFVRDAKGFQPADLANIKVDDDETASVLLKLSAAVAVTPQGGGNTQPAWPQPKFHFEVEYTVEGKTSKFEAQEVSGLYVEAQPIEYRHGDAKEITPIKMPGIKKSSDVTLKKGIFAKDTAIVEWYRSNSLCTSKRATVVIRMLDEDGIPTMVWTLKNAFPSKISGFNLNADSYETIVLSNEGVTVTQP